MMTKKEEEEEEEEKEEVQRPMAWSRFWGRNELSGGSLMRFNRSET